MRGQRSHLAYVIGGVVLIVCLAVPDGLLAQVPPKAPAPPATQTPPAPQAAPGGQPGTPSPAPGAAAPGKRDPFDPLVKKPAPGEERGIVEIAALKLVGILWDSANREQIRALVETPDGLGYYLRVNEEKFGGTVIAIDRDRVRFSVREQVPGGAARTKTVELKLGKPDTQ